MQLTEVVETYLWSRPAIDLFRDFALVAEISQHAVPEAAIRNRAQSFLDRSQCVKQVRRFLFLEHDRKRSRKPSYGARNVDSGNDFLPSMALQFKCQDWLSAPPRVG